MSVFRGGGVKRAITELFGLDLRSLALFRVALGLVILGDLFRRVFDLEAHYTDVGVLPRESLFEVMDRLRVSIHLIHGSSTVIGLLFAVHAVIAVLLLIGYRTRWMAFLNWFFVVSLCARNPMILQGGDILLRVLCTWAVFLPLGARYSVDAALATEPPSESNTFFGAASFAYLFQILLIYWFTSMLKSGAEWRTEYTAVYYALQLDHLVTPLGAWLREQDPAILQFLTAVTIHFEAYAPYLALCPVYRGPVRMLTVVLFIGLHWSFDACLTLGPFAWIATLAWIALVPGWFWDVVTRKINWERTRIAIYYDGECGFCRRAVLLLRMFLFLRYAKVEAAAPGSDAQRVMENEHSWVIAGADGASSVRYDAFLSLLRASPVFRFFVRIFAWKPIANVGEWVYRKIARNRMRASVLTRWMKPQKIRIRPTLFGNLLAAALFAYVVLWNLRGFSPKRFARFLPYKYNVIGMVAGVDQHWSMFSPFPLKEDGWFVVDGHLGNGRRLDLMHDGKPVDFSKPARIPETYGGEAWRKYLHNLWSSEFQKHREFYSRYLCYKWNHDREGDERVRYFEIVYLLEVTLPKGAETPRPVTIARWWCYDAPADPEAAKKPPDPVRSR